MIHLDELSEWTNKHSQKSEWIIWIDNTNESMEMKNADTNSSLVCN